MNCWNILCIDKTSDKDVIKKAYRSLLKTTRPDEDEQGFIRLREAYEEAIEYAENASYEEEYEDEYYEDIDGDEEDDYEQTAYLESLSEEDRRFAQWQGRIEEVYNQYDRRINIDEWKRLLYEDIPIQIKYYDRCKSYIGSIINYRMLLPHDITRLMDDFFVFTGTDVERAKNGHTENSRFYNKRLKLNEIIEFNKLVAGKDTAGGAIDEFLRLYYQLSSNVLAWEDDSFVKNYISKINQVYNNVDISYIPYECLAAGLYIPQSRGGNTEKELERLKEKYKDAPEVRLLEAEYALYMGERELAKKLLKDLYQKLPAKSYTFTYQMALCCKSAKMYYESYQLVKYLTWLRPEKWQFELANEICDKWENQIYSKGKQSDEEKVQLARIYLRSHGLNEAIRLLGEVEDRDSFAYNMANCLSIFEMEEPTSKKPESYAYLEEYPKEKLNVIDMLEWEDLKARYLYEKGMYKESIASCNKLLQEYPLSYQVLLLRSHVDYSYGQYKQSKSRTFLYGGEKDFNDLDYLLSLDEKRIETRLLIAHVKLYSENFERVLSVLEPIKDEVWLEYEYGRLSKLEDDGHYVQVIEDWKKFWDKVKNNKVSIHAVNKYRFTDLKRIYRKSANMQGNLDKNSAKAKRYYKLLVSMKESEYNHPDRYVDLREVYSSVYYGEYEVGKAYILEMLNNAKDREDIILSYQALISVYEKYGATDSMMKIYDEARKRKIYRLDSQIARILYQNEKYEEAIKIYEVKRKEKRMSIHDYGYLGWCYYYKARLDKARQVWEEATLIKIASGDYWGNSNFFYSIAYTYDKENIDKAIEYLELGRNRTESQYIRNMYWKKYGSIVDTYLWEQIKKGIIDKSDVDGIKTIIDRYPDEIKQYMGNILACAIEERLKEMKPNSKSYISLAQEGVLACKRDIEYGHKYTASYYLLSLFCNKLGKAEDALNAIVDGADKCIRKNERGDFWGWNNIFSEAYYMCKNQEKYEDAVKYLDLMMENTSITSLKENYAKKYAEAYMHTDEVWDNAMSGNVDVVEQLCNKAPKEVYAELSYVLGRAYDECAQNKEEQCGNVSECMDLINKAIEYYKIAADGGAADAAAVSYLVDLCVKIGDKETPEHYLKKITDKCLNYGWTGDYWTDSNLFYKAGEFYFEEKRWDESIRYYDFWLEYGKNKPKEIRLMCLADAYGHKRDYAMAITLFEKADRIKEHVAGKIRLGGISFCMGKFDVGSNYYEEGYKLAIKEVKKGGESDYRLLFLDFMIFAKYLFRERLGQKWVDYYEEEIKSLTNLDEAEKNYSLCNFAYATGNEDAGEEYYRKAVEILKNENKLEEIEERYSDYYAWKCIYKKEYEKAYEHLQKMEDPGYLDTALMIWIEKKLGKKD